MPHTSPSNPEQLATLLASQAKRLARVVAIALSQNIPEMVDIFQTIHRDYTPTTEADFADSYAQTVTYGLLATRWMTAKNQALSIHHLTQELPNTSPFLQRLFATLLNTKTLPTVHQEILEIVATLQTVDVKSLFQQHGISTPVIHFYESFLDRYDRTLRAKRGVYYTPIEVVHYIIHTTHNLLKDDFGLPLGLADETTWETLEARGVVTLSLIHI